MNAFEPPCECGHDMDWHELGDDRTWECIPLRVAGAPQLPVCPCPLPRPMR